MEPRIEIKPGVKFLFFDVDGLRFLDALLTCSAVFNRHFTISSGADGEHKVGSYHPKGHAWDVRLNDVAPGLREELRDKLIEQLPPYFDVVLEEFPEEPLRDHLHVEADQRKKEAID